jgi:hypothetical protein
MAGRIQCDAQKLSRDVLSDGKMNAIVTVRTGWISRSVITECFQITGRNAASHRPGA